MVLKLGHFRKQISVPGNFSNVALEKDGKDSLDLSF
jgi:hypothetical protein